MRLDLALVQAKLATSRNIAANLIKSGKVLVNGTTVAKPSYDTAAGDRLDVTQSHIYVGRAAYKLKPFLERYNLDLTDKDVLDVGASTGGFTEVLLEFGAKSVTALDVGHDQLHTRIKNDPRVVSIEGQDVRSFDHAPFEWLTCDVSFISVHYILEALHRLARTHLIILFKPQFEVGAQAKRNRSGVVTDERVIEDAKTRFEEATQVLGWELVTQAPSTLEGKEGNREYVYYFRKHH